MKPAETMNHYAPLLRIEGLVLLAAGLVLYAHLGASWLMFGLLFFVPDVSLLGYFAGPRIGARTYNTLHSEIGPLLLGTAAIAASAPRFEALSLIWIAHVGFDRALGYGLKSVAGFRHTHLGLIGRG